MMPAGRGGAGRTGNQQPLDAARQARRARRHPRHQGRRFARQQPPGHLGQAAREVPRAAREVRCAVVAVVLGQLSEPAAGNAVEGLHEERAFEATLQQEPERIAALEMRELVRQDALLLRRRKAGDRPFGQADLGPQHAAGEGRGEPRHAAQVGLAPCPHRQLEPAQHGRQRAAGEQLTLRQAAA